jgi:hypothetical protein
MAIAKTLLNALGLLLTFVGVWVVLRNSPINEHIGDGGDPFTNHAAEGAAHELKNERMRHGTYMVLVGAAVQFVTNLLPES